jgi:sulfoquinovosidase
MRGHGRTVAAFAGAAPAAVQVREDRVVIEGAQVRAVVQRAPYALRIERPDGTAVVRTLEATGAPPQLSAAVPDEPGGGNALPDGGDRYEPLTFEVGGSAPVQYPASPWVGNLLVSARAGALHAATRVLEARAEGDAAELVVATTDADRRWLVRLEPDGRQGIRVRARITPDAGVTAVAESFASPAGEAFQGFGGRHDELDQRGSDFHSYIDEQAQGAGPLQPLADQVPNGGKERYLFPNGPESAFYQSASFVSSRAYGFLLASTELARFRLATPRRPDAWQVDVAGPAIDYSIFAGRDEKDAVGALTAVTGRHRVPPEWALGPTLYRGIRVLSAESDDAETYERKVRADLAEFDRDPPPMTSYALEGWDLMSRGQTKALVAEIRKRGLRPMAYLRSYTSPDPGRAERPEVFTTALANGYLTETPLGTPFLFGSTFIAGPAGLIDFTKPAARAWWRGRVREVLDLGFDGFMQDFGEQVLEDMRFADGSTGKAMHNAYPTLYHRTTREVVEEWERENPDRGKVFFFTRTGYSGRPGSPAFEQSNFPGDETTDWSRASGLGSLVTDMLNRALGGAYGYNTDIGGYADSITGPVTKELFIRWSQAAALMPVHRVHNSSSTGTKMPWSFDAEARRLYTATAQLHTDARPLILRLWREAERTGVPMTRAMTLEHPGEPGARGRDQQFHLGPDVLVAPVVTEGARTKEVWFPPGCWSSPETGERFTGPREVRVAAPLDRLPWFVRCGKRPFAASSTCASRRAFEIRLPRGARSARVTVAGKPVRTARRGRRLVAKVDLRGRGRGATTVKVVARTARGTVRETRTYRPCVRRAPRGR